MGLSSNLLRKGHETVGRHHGQKFSWKGQEFVGIARPLEVKMGPGPIGLTVGRDFTVTICVDRKAISGALPISGDAIYAEDGRRFVVGGVSEQPGGFSVRFWCRVDNYR